LVQWSRSANNKNAVLYNSKDDAYEFVSRAVYNAAKRAKGKEEEAKRARVMRSVGAVGLAGLGGVGWWVWSWGRK
jgi:hypothetical protein